MTGAEDLLWEPPGVEFGPFLTTAGLLLLLLLLLLAGAEAAAAEGLWFDGVGGVLRGGLLGAAFLLGEGEGEDATGEAACCC